MDIEKLATSAIEDIISKTDFISSYVNSGDKEPCWDGNLYAYSDKSKKIEYYIGKVPVQVKGQSCQQFADDELKFLVRKIDLINYRTEGGTIYFVVQVNGFGEKKIFYNSLLPFDINNLLKGKEKRNKISVRFKPFPIDKNEVTNVITNFLRDKEGQVLVKNGENISLEELKKQFGEDKLKFTFSFSGLGYDKNKPYEYFLHNDIYLYAEHKDLNIKVPLNHLQNAEACRVNYSGKIKIADTVFYDGYSVLHKKDESIIEIGKSLKFSLKEENALKVIFSLDGNLDERIVAQEMMIELFKAGYFELNGVRLELNTEAEDTKSFDLKSMKEQLDHFENVKEVLTLLGVYEPLECTNLTERDEERIRMLLLSHKFGTTFTFDNDAIPPLAKFALGNLTLLLYFNRQYDGKYSIEKHENFKAYITAEDAEGVHHETSKYTILTSTDFAEISNLNAKYIVDELISINNPEHLIRVNLTLLEMIKAYDMKHNISLLEEATRLAEWIHSIEESDISLLNILQCKIRLRNLTEEEEDTLETIIENSSGNNQVKAGAYILLGNAKKSNKIIDAFPPDEKAVFINYPIYNLAEFIN